MYFANLVSTIVYKTIVFLNSSHSLMILSTCCSVLTKTYSFFKDYFPNSKTLRRYPLLLTLHKSIDGALFGVLVSGAVMTAFTLHSQHLWTQNFSKLQLTRDLSHRLEESTAILERYFLSSASYPQTMVITKSSHLLYLDRPKDEKRTIMKDFMDAFRKHFESVFYPIANGY